METETKFENAESLTDSDKETIANLIKEGCTSGRCDSEDSCIAWELRWNKWND